MKTILFVDDDRSFRELFRRVFQDEGYRVLLAEDGAGAISAAGVEQVDVAVLDVRMPGMSGFEVAEQLSALAPELPLILYTANDDMCTVDARARYAMACVDKNTGFTELAMAVSRVLSPSGRRDAFRIGLPPRPATVAL
ncbi:MAG: response regulator [Planctomycetaceae bacterium]|nr:response regulator [Planctomycetaceae bacterium]